MRDFRDKHHLCYCHIMILTGVKGEIFGNLLCYNCL